MKAFWLCSCTLIIVSITVAQNTIVRTFVHRLVFLYFLSVLAPSFLYAQGSSVVTAAALSINSSASGSMSDNSHDHYWKITTSTDGYLRVEINSSSSIEVDATLYDVNGTSSVHYDGRFGTYSELYGFLKPGTYYVYAYRYSGTTGTYTISTTFTSPSRAGDTEPNDTPANAQSLSPTGTATGRLGFFSNGSTDTEDYWKVTTTQDGWLRVQIRSDSLDLRGDQLYDLDATMYDVNGTSNVSYDGRYGTFSQVAAFLRPGIYYIRVYRYAGRGGSYEITSDFFAPPLANDVEGNDSYQTASAAVINGSVTGHVGYFSNGTTDDLDYWKFTVPSDGKITVRVTSDSLDRSGVPLDLDLAAFDINGTSTIAYDGRYGPFSEIILYLQPGTFYAKVYRYSGNAGSYTLSITHTPPTLANDVEGNDSPANATPLSYGLSSAGHSGYFSNGTRDDQDYWRLIAPASDSIYVYVTSDSTLDLDLTAYGSNGTTVIASDVRTGIFSKVGIIATAGTTYYFKLNRYSGTAGGYSILATRSSVVSVDDQGHKNLVPTELTLEQNYPNPFNPSTTISYSLPSRSHTKLSVFDVSGREVSVLVDVVQEPGTYSVRFEGNSLSSSTYFYKLQTDRFSETRKMVLLK